VVTTESMLENATRSCDPARLLTRHWRCWGVEWGKRRVASDRPRLSGMDIRGLPPFLLVGKAYCQIKTELLHL